MQPATEIPTAFHASPSPARKTRPRAETVRAMAGDPQPGRAEPAPADDMAAEATEAVQDRRAAEIDAETERFAAFVEGEITFA